MSLPTATPILTEETTSSPTGEPTATPAPAIIGTPMDFSDASFTMNETGLFYCTKDQNGIFLLEQGKQWAAQYCEALSPTSIVSTKDGVFFTGTTGLNSGLFKAEQGNATLLTQGDINWFDFEPLKGRLLVCVSNNELYISNSPTDEPTLLYTGTLSFAGLCGNMLMLVDGGKLLYLDLSIDKPSAKTLVENGVVDVFINGENIYYSTETDANIYTIKIGESAKVFAPLPTTQYTIIYNNLYTLSKTEQGIWLNKNAGGYLFLKDATECSLPYFDNGNLYVLKMTNDYFGLVSIDKNGTETRLSQVEG